MSIQCAHCSRKFQSDHNRQEHEINCIDQYIVSGVPRAEYHIYIFVFVAFDKQRYYIGQTSNPRMRASDHFGRDKKTIWPPGNKIVAESRHITPISIHIVDTAQSREKAHIKERETFINMVRDIEDSSMVCGGR